jgi:hypothetical protein
MTFGTLGINIRPQWAAQLELGWAATEDTGGIAGDAFRYLLNVVYTLPVVYRHFWLQAILGVGGSSFVGFAADEHGLAIEGGLGLRYYPHWRRRVAITLDARYSHLRETYGVSDARGYWAAAGVRVGVLPTSYR